MKPVITTPKLAFKIAEEECIKGFISSSEPVLFTIPLGLEIDNQWNFTAKIEVVNNDGKEGYLLSNSVVLENDGIVTFEPGKETSLKVSVSPGSSDDLTNLVVGGRVAIKIAEIEGINFDFDSREFNLTVTGKEYEYNNKRVDASMLSFNFPAFVDNTTAASLFDKDPATYVQTPYPNRNFANTGGSNPYLQLQLPEGVTDFAISWIQCLQNEVSLLRGFDVLWSVDGTFNDIPNARQSYSLADLNASGAVSLGASFTTSACHCDTPVKFIRIVQTWNCESTTDAGGRWQFRLAELKLYGVSIE